MPPVRVPVARRLPRWSPAAVAIESSPSPAATNGRATARQPRSTGEVVLASSGVTVRFGGLVANDDVTVEVRAGAVTGVIGPNGAGKTTFFNVLTGAVRPTSGTVTLDGRDVTGWSRHALAAAGLARTFQNLALFDNLTVRENVEVGAVRFAPYDPLSGVLRLPRARRQERIVHTLAERALALVGVEALADARVADISYGDRRRVEVARALALGPKVLLLDEPSAGMDPVETRQLGAVIDRIVDELGLPVLLVEHDMSMVSDVVDHLYVLDFGRILVEGSPQDVLADEQVIAAYLGTGEVR